jgi:hypothetical protein
MRRRVEFAGALLYNHRRHSTLPPCRLAALAGKCLAR